MGSYKNLLSGLYYYVNSMKKFTIRLANAILISYDIAENPVSKWVISKM